MTAQSTPLGGSRRASGSAAAELVGAASVDPGSAPHCGVRGTPEPSSVRGMTFKDAQRVGSVNSAAGPARVAGWLLDDATFRALCAFAPEAARVRRLSGLPPLAQLDALAERATRAARVSAGMSDRGHADTPAGADGQAEFMTTNEVARLLGKNARTIRRRAAELDGVLVDGCWFIPRAAVEEHLAGGTPCS